MVSARPWHPSAIMRLTLCLVVCLFCGSLLISSAYRMQSGHHDLRYYRLTASAFGSAAVALVFVYRPWNAGTVVTRLGGYLLFLYGGFLLTYLAHNSGEPMPPSVSQMIIATLSLQGAALVLIPHFLSEQALGWDEAFGFANSPARAMIWGVIGASLFLPLGMGLQWLSAEAMLHLPRLHLKPEQQESVQTLQMAVSWTNRLGLGVVTILVAPLAEEMFFRGILYPAVKKAGFPRLALWGTALFFGVVHMNFVTFIPLVVLAIGLTLLYERTNNLWAPITAHSLFNALNFIILYSTLGPLPNSP
jgi:membrane protease YdiL (CAAX protease family)